ncbi:MAG: type II secretion system protein [Bacteriovorax sp.]
MKKFIQKCERGFTLIELMVVVAIIGVLSAIAVPNFKKYQAKAKQSEAKIQLAAIYSVEVGSMADYDAFATCLLVLGYDQPPKGYYILGFTASEVAAVAVRNAACVAATTIVPTTQLKSGAAAAAASGNMDASTVVTTGVTFLAAAAGNISAALFDKWTISETKALTNTNAGY